MAMTNDTKINKVLVQFGANVLRMRERAELTQEEVASALGMSRISLVYIEGGKNRTTIENILRLCALFKCTPTELLPPVPEATTSHVVVSKKVIEKTALKAKFKW